MLVTGGTFAARILIGFLLEVLEHRQHLIDDLLDRQRPVNARVVDTMSVVRMRLSALRPSHEVRTVRPSRASRRPAALPMAPQSLIATVIEGLRRSVS